ncbi:YchJ family protein [Psychromonas sp. RZ22]|uniref:YchJ family protein n=1 Tax=Psychromonas algarum TaxID=2555643 RepID=UPI001068BB9F|nr:YchJ family protein [Psychromonas sp. RZ22]TEW56196.1 YchJ family protein [Psychromonas sp. RZ22]
METTYCHCKSGLQYKDCCQPFHLLQKKPNSSEQLMRSRYSAFCLQLGEYLFSTYHPNYRGDLTTEILSEPSLNWVNLEIIATESLNNTGFVEFKAWYIDKEQLNCHHERSNFVKDHEQWFYCDGTFYPNEKSGKISRNDSCPCGSGKKYKKCCA